MKMSTCKECEVAFELPVRRGRPAVRCEPCRSKSPTVLAFSLVDGVTWIESVEPCEGCGKIFQRPRKRGRVPKKCPDCSSWAEAEKAALIGTSQETLDELFNGDRAFLLGTPGALPKGNEAQCPRKDCGRIFTSDNACERHKRYNPSVCVDPASIGMEPRERVRGEGTIPVWTSPR